MNETIVKFGYPDTLIKEFENWVVLLRPEQITIGTLVLAAKSNARHLAELDQGTWAEFDVVSKFAEGLLQKIFGAEKFNYMALMMKDPNVHFHFIPRYSKPIELGGKQFIDPDWPLRTQFQPIQISEHELESIKTKLKQ